MPQGKNLSFVTITSKGSGEDCIRVLKIQDVHRRMSYNERTIKSYSLHATIMNMRRTRYKCPKHSVYSWTFEGLESVISVGFFQQTGMCNNHWRISIIIWVIDDWLKKKVNAQAISKPHLVNENDYSRMYNGLDIMHGFRIMHQYSLQTASH